MASFGSEITALQNYGLLPDGNYLSGSRFAQPYKNTGELWVGLATPIALPLVNGVTSMVYAIRAVWAALRAVGNLLIIKPGAAGDAIGDVALHLSLTIALGVMAPINALTSALELLTRTVASWFSNEPTEDLTRLGFRATFTNECEDVKDFLPSSSYLNRGRFFAPHKDVLSFIGSLATPFASGLSSGFTSLYHALHAVNAAIHLIANIVIAKPKHASESLRDFGVHTSLALSLAVMAPINALVDSIACITRLGSTWVDAVRQNEEPESDSLKFA